MSKEKMSLAEKRQWLQNHFDQVRLPLLMASILALRSLAQHLLRFINQQKMVAWRRFTTLLLPKLSLCLPCLKRL